MGRSYAQSTAAHGNRSHLNLNYFFWGIITQDLQKHPVQNGEDIYVFIQPFWRVLQPVLSTWLLAVMPLAVPKVARLNDTWA